jgi:hypothetical protein
MQDTDDMLDRLGTRISELEAQLAAFMRRVEEHDERIRHLNNLSIVVTADGIRLERNTR